MNSHQDKIKRSNVITWSRQNCGSRVREGPQLYVCVTDGTLSGALRGSGKPAIQQPACPLPAPLSQGWLWKSNPAKGEVPFLCCTESHPKQSLCLFQSGILCSTYSNTDGIEQN